VTTDESSTSGVGGPGDSSTTDGAGDQPTTGDASSLKPQVSNLTPPPGVSLADFQNLIRGMYHEKDVARGIDGTFMWLMEEVGELAAALREGTPEEQAAEFADVLAWLTTIANVADVDLSAAVKKKYGSGCPGCGALACTCPDAEKP